MVYICSVKVAPISYVYCLPASYDEVAVRTAASPMSGAALH